MKGQIESKQPSESINSKNIWTGGKEPIANIKKKVKRLKGKGKLSLTRKSL